MIGGEERLRGSEEVSQPCGESRVDTKISNEMSNLFARTWDI
jgi:hypothetical protein